MNLIFFVCHFYENLLPVKWGLKFDTAGIPVFYPSIGRFRPEPLWVIRDSEAAHSGFEENGFRRNASPSGTRAHLRVAGPLIRLRFLICLPCSFMIVTSRS